MAPYGCLGRTGLLLDGEPLMGLHTVTVRPRIIATRWLPGGHSTYFTSWNIETTFRQILQDITTNQREMPNPYVSPSNPFPRVRRY